MELTQDFDELQKASNYRTIRKALRNAGIGSIVFGSIALLAGLPGVSESLLDAGLAIIGLMLLSEGLWILKAPSPKGLIADGIVLIILGAWNILTSILDTAEGLRVARGFVMLGGWQIIWGIQSIGRYKLFAEMPMARPPDHVLRWLDDLAKRIHKTGTAEVSDIIVFQADSEKKKSWRALLCGDTAVLVQGDGEHLVFARRGDVYITSHGEAGVGNLIRITHQVGELSEPGLMSPEYLERYTIWKEGNWASFGGIKLADLIDWEIRPQPRPDLGIDIQSAQYAGFWRRFAASIIDSLVLCVAGGGAYYAAICIMLMVFAAIGFSDQKSDQVGGEAASWILLVLLVIAPWLYFSAMESSSKQGTLGKIALGIAVTDTQGNRISFCRATKRHLGKIISAMVFFAGFIMAATMEKKQALHDIMTDCLVVVRRQHTTYTSM